MPHQAGGHAGRAGDMPRAAMGTILPGDPQPRKSQNSKSRQPQNQFTPVCVNGTSLERG